MPSRTFRSERSGQCRAMAELASAACLALWATSCTLVGSDAASICATPQAESELLSLLRSATKDANIAVRDTPGMLDDGVRIALADVQSDQDPLRRAIIHCRAKITILRDVGSNIAPRPIRYNAERAEDDGTLVYSIVGGSQAIIAALLPRANAPAPHPAAVLSPSDAPLPTDDIMTNGAGRAGEGQAGEGRAVEAEGSAGLASGSKVSPPPLAKSTPDRSKSMGASASSQRPGSHSATAAGRRPAAGSRSPGERSIAAQGQRAARPANPTRKTTADRRQASNGQRGSDGATIRRNGTTVSTALVD